jgi:hypothetical protein
MHWDNEGQGLRDRVGWDEAGADAFLERLERERHELARARFVGRDPSVRGPRGAKAVDVMARVLAADREGALVRLDDGSVNPGEDRAEAALQRAIGALTNWGFDTVRRELGEAAALARVASRQQRIGLIRALAMLVRALVVRAPGERLRGEEGSARELLRRLDELSDEEKAHYDAELTRLVGLWRSAATDDAEWRAWALLRGRLALRDGAEESALAWALRAWDRQEVDTRAAAPGLAALLTSVRAVFRPLVEGPDITPEVDARGKPVEPPRAGDVLPAVAAALAAREGADEPFAGAQRFALVPFHPAPVRDAAEAAT